MQPRSHWRLFQGQPVQARRVEFSTIASAPESAAPIDAVAAALEAVVPVFKERHERARQRQAVIAANPGFQERELLKRASLAAAMADALRNAACSGP